MSRRLRFFEKNIFDPNANEKPTVTTNDNPDGIDNIKSNYKQTYKANPAISTFNKVSTPIEYLSFITNGNKSKITFKNVNITSGESEIIASTQRPAESKRVAVSMSATANLAQVVEPDPTDNTITIPVNDITIPRVRFNPSLTVEIGNIVRIFSDGFQNRRRYLTEYQSSSDPGRRRLVQAYSSLVTFFLSNVTGTYFHRDSIGLLRKDSAEGTLPPSILEQQESSSFTGGTVSQNFSSRYSYLLNPLAETVHYKLSGNYIRTKAFKDFIFNGSGTGSRISIPILQKVRVENPEVEYVKSDGDALPSEQNFSERIRQFFPDKFEFNASHFDIEHKAIVHRSTVTPVVNEEYNPISQTTTATQYQKVTANFICKITLKSDIVNLLTPEGKSFLFKPVITGIPNNNESGSFAVYEPVLISYRTGGRHEYRDGPTLEHLTFGQAFADVTSSGDPDENPAGSPEIIDFDDDGGTTGGVQPATGFILLQNSAFVTREVTNGTVSPHSDPAETLITSLSATERNARLVVTGVFQRFGEKVKEELNQYFNFENGRPEVNPENALDVNSTADVNLIDQDMFLNDVDSLLTDLGLVQDNIIKVNGANVATVTAAITSSLPGSYGLSPEGELTRLEMVHISNTGIDFTSNNLNIPLAIEGEDSDTLDLLPISFSSLNYNYEIVAFNRGIGFRTDGIVVKQNNEEFMDDELNQIRIEDNEGNITEYRDAVTIYNRGSYNDHRPDPADGHPFARFTDRLGEVLQGFLTPQPKLLTEWYNLLSRPLTLSQIFSELTEPEKNIKLWVTSDTVPIDTSDDIPINPNPQQPTQEEDNRQSILSNIDGDFPFINVNSIFYDDTTRRIHLIMGRQSPHAPVPNKTFFGNFRIANRVFGFASSRYRRYSNATSSTNPYGARVADYSWSTSLNFLQNRKTARIGFSKTGTSYTNEVNRQFTVKQSTIETNTYEERSGNVLGGLRVKDISFVTGTSFKVTFYGDVANTDFDAISVRDKDDTSYITRNMKPADATRLNSQADDETSYEWENLAEFHSVRHNKEYILEMIQNSSTTENRFFLPRPLQNNTDTLSNINIDDQDINFTLQEANSQEVNRPYNAFAILNTDGTNYTPWLDYDAGAETIDGNKKVYSYDTGAAITAPEVGTKFNFVFEKKLFPPLQFNIIRMTHNYFDTVVLLNTNLSDISLHDAMGVELIHPTDIEELIITTEDNLRHVILNLKNPIASEVVYLSSREKFGSNNTRFLGQMLLLKSIGEFSQYPRVTVDSSNSREVVNTQFNLSHVKSLPNAINYQMEFPPLNKEKDLLLAQDLYSRVSNYNEFVVWASGGDASKLKGFKVVDFVKCLCSNDFQFSYVDGRFSSGVTFNMNLVNVY